MLLITSKNLCQLTGGVISCIGLFPKQRITSLSFTAYKQTRSIFAVIGSRATVITSTTSKDSPLLQVQEEEGYSFKTPAAQRKNFFSNNYKQKNCLAAIFGSRSKLFSKTTNQHRKSFAKKMANASDQKKKVCIVGSGNW